MFPLTVKPPLECDTVMCELFAMSSRLPAAVTYSLHEFAENGSRRRHNRDGWGIAFARDRAIM